jgi:hypothetical protein
MTGWLAVNFLALAGVVGYLARLAWLPDGLIRLRNALLLLPGVEADFHWTPEAMPSDFKKESREPDAAFVAIIHELCPNGQGDWDKAMQIAAHLAEHAQDKGPLQDELVASYRGIRNGYGYCADFVKVFLALACAAGITARQWAFSFDGFGGHGHTFVEVFDRQRNRWLFIDPHNNFHVIDEVTGEPLSALEFRERLLGRGGPLRMQPNGPGRLGFIHEHKALDYFRRGAAEWYMWWGNAVFSYYAHPLVRAAGHVSRVLAHLLANFSGIHPRLRIYPVAENRAATARMFALQRRLRVSGGLGLGLFMVLLAQLKFGAAA